MGWPGLKFVVFAVMSSGAVASAHVVNPVPSIGPAAQSLIARTDPGALGIIHGTAIDINSSPLPHTTVRLRNLQTGQIEQISSANQMGEFSFAVQPEIPYVVEVADRAGRIIAVGNVVVVQAGAVAGAMVFVPTRLPAVAGIFSQTAGSVVSAGVGAGLTAFAAIPPRLPQARSDNVYAPRKSRRVAGICLADKKRNSFRLGVLQRGGISSSRA